MNFKQYTAGLSAALLILFSAGNTLAQTTDSSCGEECSCADGKAPIGVMGDHVHKEGDVMFSYRLMYMSMDGNRSGTDTVSNQQVFDMGFDRTPTEMTMEMHMFGAMYAPSDDVTLMLMANYIRKDMEMVSDTGGMSHDAMGHGGMSMGHAMTEHSGMEMDAEMHSGHADGTHKHSTSGWGDTVATALFRIWGDCCQSLHVGLGVGLPTADVEERMAGMLQPYGMQLGNGVWDARPSVTYNGGGCGLNWGAQVSGRFNLEDENDAGFAYGDQVQATTWVSREVSKGIRLSGRVVYDHQEELEGDYDEMHSTGSPPFFPENYGGEVIQAGVGVSLSGESGHRLAVEALIPVHEDLNGVQMSRDYSFVLGWQKTL